MMEQYEIENYKVELGQEGMKDSIEVSWTESPLLLVDKANEKCSYRLINA